MLFTRYQIFLTNLLKRITAFYNMY